MLRRYQNGGGANAGMILLSLVLERQRLTPRRFVVCTLQVPPTTWQTLNRFAAAAGSSSSNPSRLVHRAAAALPPLPASQFNGRNLCERRCRMSCQHPASAPPYSVGRPRPDTTTRPRIDRGPTITTPESGLRTLNIAEPNGTDRSSQACGSQLIVYRTE